MTSRNVSFLSGSKHQTKGLVGTQGRVISKGRRNAVLRWSGLFVDPCKAEHLVLRRQFVLVLGLSDMAFGALAQLTAAVSQATVLQ